MEKECIHCGLPFRLYEKGRLFIEKEADDNSFRSASGEWFQAEYQSVDELEGLLNKAAKNSVWSQMQVFLIMPISR